MGQRYHTELLFGYSTPSCQCIFQERREPKQFCPNLADRRWIRRGGIVSREAHALNGFAYRHSFQGQILARFLKS
jgi:hypothetical protein